MALAEILASVVFISLLSFVGVVSLALKKERLHGILLLLVAFASGSLLAASFFHMIPESTEGIGAKTSTLVLAGIVFFFIVEKFIHWHHCSKDECHVRPVGYLNIIGDGIHNFIDGVVIAAAYLAGMKMGLITTLVIALHEVPQEFGDFAVLLHAGFGTKKALTYNFVSATTAIAGGLAGYLFLSNIQSYIPHIVALAAGGFIYIATADLIPELHKEREVGKLVAQTIAFLVGILMLYSMIAILPH